jgi:hypothetical protein
MAVCYHTLYGEFRRKQPMKRGKFDVVGDRRTWWVTTDAYRRSKLLLSRAVLIDENAMDSSLSEVCVCVYYY